jgi:hypothetical protein
MAYVAPGYVAPGYVADEEGAGAVSVTVAATGAVIYTGTTAVVASIGDGAGTVTAEVAATGTVIYTGTAAVVAAITTNGPATFSEPRGRVTLRGQLAHIGGRVTANNSQG